MDSGFQVLDSGLCSVELGFRISTFTGLPDSLSCIPDSKAQDSGFLKLHSLTWGDELVALFVRAGRALKLEFS